MAVRLAYFVVFSFYHTHANVIVLCSPVMVLITGTGGQDESDGDSEQHQSFCQHLPFCYEHGNMCKSETPERKGDRQPSLNSY